MSVSASLVAVGTSATQLSPATSDAVPGSTVVVSNPSGNATVFLGGSNVTVAAGWPLAPGATISLDLTGQVKDEILYAVAAATGNSVNVLATGV